MLKLLLLVAGLFVAYWILKGYRRKVERRSAEAPRDEDMVRCAHCGVHLPRSESVTSTDASYCCAEHRRIHENAG